jgi:hypothetical protein
VSHLNSASASLSDTELDNISGGTGIGAAIGFGIGAALGVAVTAAQAALRGRWSAPPSWQPTL